MDKNSQNQESLQEVLQKIEEEKVALSIVEGKNVGAEIAILKRINTQYVLLFQKSNDTHLLKELLQDAENHLKKLQNKIDILPPRPETEHLKMLYHQISAEFYFEYAFKLESFDKYDFAIKHYEILTEPNISQETFRQNQLVSYYVSLYHKLGICYIEKAYRLADQLDVDDVITLAQKTLPILKEVLNFSDIDRIYFEIWNNTKCYLGRAYMILGKYTIDVNIAKKNFEQALQYLEECVKDIELCSITPPQQRNYLGFLSNAFFEYAMKTTDNEKAKKLLDSAIFYRNEQVIQDNNHKTEATPEEISHHTLSYHSWIAFYYRRFSEKANLSDSEYYFELAIDSYHDWLTLAQTLNDNNEILEAQQGVGACYLNRAALLKESKEEVEQLAQKAINIFNHQKILAIAYQNKLKVIEATILIIYGYLLIANSQKNNEKELTFLEKAIMEENIQDLAVDTLEEQRLKNTALLHITTPCINYAKKTQNHSLKHTYLNKAIKIILLLSDGFKKKTTPLSLRDYLIAQYNLAVCYENQASFNKALQVCDNALTILHHVSENESIPEKKRILAILQVKKKELLWLSGQYDEYLKYKKDNILQLVFHQKESSVLSDIVGAILGILLIDPIEVKNIPFAHYTSPKVSKILFGFDESQGNTYLNIPTSPLRMCSPVGMNDISEGMSLKEFVNLQNKATDKQIHSQEITPFFLCFSSRVNDLNQFRLYGKEDGIDASGCCLVFNKYREWLLPLEISKTDYFDAIRPTTDKHPVMQENYLMDHQIVIKALIGRRPIDAPPLYQVVYMTALDEYLNARDYDFNLNGSNKQPYCVLLKPIGNFPEWHQTRVKALKYSLEKLADYFQTHDSTLEDMKLLEYIRFLFKDFSFKDEDEFRVLQLESIHSQQVQHDNNSKRIFLNYGHSKESSTIKSLDSQSYSNISDLVDAVILGVNYERTSLKNKAEIFRYQMAKKFPDIKVIQSNLPISAP